MKHPRPSLAVTCTGASRCETQTSLAMRAGLYPPPSSSPWHCCPTAAHIRSSAAPLWPSFGVGDGRRAQQVGRIPAKTAESAGRGGGWEEKGGALIKLHWKISFCSSLLPARLRPASAAPRVNKAQCHQGRTCVKTTAKTQPKPTCRPHPTLGAKVGWGGVKKSHKATAGAMQGWEAAHAVCLSWRAACCRLGTVSASHREPHWWAAVGFWDAP